MSGSQYWKKGFLDAIPIGLGYLAVSFSVGIQAAAIGMSALQAVILSASNVTSAGQMAGLVSISTGASLLEVALAQLIINSRYCLMSCALAQKLERGAPPFHRFFMAHGVTDEIFGISVCRPEALSPFYMYGAMSAAIPGWVVGTFLGVISGELLPLSLTQALGAAIYGMFLAIIVPAARQNRVVLAVTLAAMLASLALHVTPMFNTISPGARIILITVVLAALAAWRFPITEKEA